MWTAPIFLLRYAEPRKVPTNSRWCPYAKGSPREGQSPQMSNSIESHEPSPRASGSPLPASSRMLPAISTIELPAETLWASFHPVHGGGRDTNAVITVSQESHPTQCNYNDLCKSQHVMWFFLNPLY
jgi:hypothetical protein